MHTASSVASGSSVIKRSSICRSCALSSPPMLIFIIKRSSCASGNGNVPWDSSGFCVAATIKFCVIAQVSESIVTCPSAIASSRLACVRGVARLISSARRISVKIGPFRSSNSPLFILKKLIPVTSDGMISGVNCMRLNSPPMVLANARNSMVFPVPGTSSKRTCPPHRKHTASFSEISSLPRITFAQLFTTLSRKSFNFAISVSFSSW